MTELKPTAVRVWDAVEKRYLTEDDYSFYLSLSGVLMEERDVTAKCGCCKDWDESGDYPADPTRYTVERFTGLCDREGRVVFEGDRVQALKDGFFTDKGFVYNVEWKQAEAEFVLKGRLSAPPSALSDCVIIGHIHDEGRGGDG